MEGIQEPGRSFQRGELASRVLACVCHCQAGWRFVSEARNGGAVDEEASKSEERGWVANVMRLGSKTMKGW